MTHPDRRQDHEHTEPATPHTAVSALTGSGATYGLLTPTAAGSRVEAATGDLAFLQAMLDAEAALARAQARLGLVPDECAEIIGQAAQAPHFDLESIARRSATTANPIVALVSDLTAVVAELDARAADYVHRGSTSQDVLDTGLMLAARRALVPMEADLTATADALARLALEYRDTPMAGRTLTQHAVPTTFGLKAATWLCGVLDARRLLRATLETGLPAQLGGAAGTLGGYVEFAVQAGLDGDRYAADLLTGYAAETGLAEPLLPWHANRVPIAQLGAVLGLIAGALGKFATDVLVLARSEIAEASEPGGAGHGVSSAMPHKSNPVLATRVRAAALQTPHLVAALLACMAGEDERPAGHWHAEWQPLRECIRAVGAAAECAAQLAQGLSVHPEAMRANLGLHGELVASERVSVALTPTLGKTAARALLTRLSARSRESGTPLRELLADEPSVRTALSAQQLDVLLDPAQYVGAAGALVDRMLVYWRKESAA